MHPNIYNSAPQISPILIYIPWGFPFGINKVYTRLGINLLLLLLGPLHRCSTTRPSFPYLAADKVRSRPFLIRDGRQWGLLEAVEMRVTEIGGRRDRADVCVHPMEERGQESYLQTDPIPG